MTPESSPPTVDAIVANLAQSFPQVDDLCSPLREAAEAICRSHRAGGKVLLCGNGGSAADCSHIVGELAKGFLRARRDADALAAVREAAGEPEGGPLDKLQAGLCAIDLGSAHALLTAVSNDLPSELIFAQPVYAMGRPGDVLVGLSTSGNSTNVVRAMQVARAREMFVVGFRGPNAGRMDEYCDIVFGVPGENTPAVQELHLPLYHALCAIVEAQLFD